MIPELAWTGACVFGAVYSAINLGAARGDLRYREDHALDGVGMIAAKGNVRRERTRLIGWMLYLSVGLAALVAPGRPRPPPTTFDVVLTIALITAVAINAANAYFDDRDRRAISRYEVPSLEGEGEGSKDEA